MRRAALPLLLVAALAAPATAATIQGTSRADALRGTNAADRISARGGDDLVQAAFGGRDSIACGPGRDVVSADRADRVTRDCEVVSRRLSNDLSTNPESQHETAVEPDSFAFGSTVVATFQLGRFEEGAASNIGFATSTDAGRTWRTGALPGLTVESSPPGTVNRASDPAVAYDAEHGTWLISTLGVGSGSYSILVSRSSDGVHWSAPVATATGQLLDKEWVACDNGTASPFRGRCYVVYTDDARHQVVSQVSTDGGATWQPPVSVARELVGAMPVVRPDGSLVVLASDLPDSGPAAIVATRSTDGGATFAPLQTVSNLTFHRPGDMRAFPLPSAEADRSGRVYAVWHDCRFRSGCTSNDIVLSTSADGVTWSPPARVSIDPTTSRVDHFLPGIAASPAADGRLAIVYAFFQPGPCARNDCRLEIGFTTSADGGTTWSRPQRLDAQAIPMQWLPRSEGGYMVGDYFSTSFAGGRAVPVFALAAPRLNGRFREGIFAASLPG
jgi:hypothetical protein